MNLKEILVALTLSLLFVMPAEADTILVASDEWCPYNCAEGSTPEGYVIDVMREIFSPAGIAIEYDVMGWERALVEAQFGRATAVIGASPDEVMGFVLPEEEIIIDSFGFFVSADDAWRYKGLESLIGKRIGLSEGYDLGPAFNEFLKKHKRDLDVYYAGRKAPVKNLLKLLEKRRLDVICDDTRVIYYVAHVMGINDKIAFAGTDDAPTKLYVAFSPVHPQSREFARIFDNGIRKMRASGRLKSILHNYGLKDWMEPVEGQQ